MTDVECLELVSALRAVVLHADRGARGDVLIPREVHSHARDVLLSVWGVDPVPSRRRGTTRSGVPGSRD